MFGSEWIAHEDVERSVLAHPPSCPCDANQQILRAGGQVRHASTGDVVVMKGARWGEGEAGVVHRSPPIEHAAITRAVLIISAADKLPPLPARPRGRRAPPT